MSDLLAIFYVWLKAFHIMAVIAWMAGLFYLPRLFVYHAERATESTTLHDTLVVMEEKLLRVIMNPAMIAAWGAGFLLVLTPGIVDWSLVWPWTKLFGLIGMTGFHMWCAKRRKLFLARANTTSGRGLRAMNEVPTVLMVLIVVSVVVKF